MAAFRAAASRTGLQALSVLLPAAAMVQSSCARCDRLKSLDKPKSEVVWEEVYPVEYVRLAELKKLRDLGFKSRNVKNRDKDTVIESASGEHYSKLVHDGDLVFVDIVRTEDGHQDAVRAFPRGGPRESLHFDPGDVRACVVNCGGLCPGLNSVIHHIVTTLNSQYGVQTIYGIRGGYRGLGEAAKKPALSANALVKARGGQDFGAVHLMPYATKGINHLGGTVLGSARGGLAGPEDEERIMQFLRDRGINLLFVIGGDGTHRGAHRLAQACVDAGLEVAVAGVPKTIDNDVALIDRSFGFDSSCEAAQDALRSAKVEAMGNMPNGVAIVKLMGRSSGYISAYASISNADVDLVLIPEVPIELDGPKSCLKHIESVVAQKGHAVIVVAEGAGEELLGASAEVDAGGNKKLPEVGVFMKKKITEHFAAIGKECKVVYIEPSYMIRSVPANAQDSYLCYVLASNAVHGAMAGYTAFTSGMINNHSVLIPIPAITEASPRTMNPKGRTWQRVMAITGQPSE